MYPSVVGLVLEETATGITRRDVAGVKKDANFSRTNVGKPRTFDYDVTRTRESKTGKDTATRGRATQDFTPAELDLSEMVETVATYQKDVKQRASVCAEELAKCSKLLTELTRKKVDLTAIVTTLRAQLEERVKAAIEFTNSENEKLRQDDETRNMAKLAELRTTLEKKHDELRATSQRQHDAALQTKDIEIKTLKAVADTCKTELAACKREHAEETAKLRACQDREVRARQNLATAKKQVETEQALLATEKNQLKEARTKVALVKAELESEQTARASVTSTLQEVRTQLAEMSVALETGKDDLLSLKQRLQVCTQTAQGDNKTVERATRFVQGVSRKQKGSDMYSRVAKERSAATASFFDDRSIDRSFDRSIDDIVAEARASRR